MLFSVTVYNVLRGLLFFSSATEMQSSKTQGATCNKLGRCFWRFGKTIHRKLKCRLPAFDWQAGDQVISKVTKSETSQLKLCKFQFSILLIRLKFYWVELLNESDTWQ